MKWRRRPSNGHVLALSRENLAGSVVATVQVLFPTGYGYANVAKTIAVMPESTLFRPRSISKPFVWTAVMQQVEQGTLDLDRDVNEYLDFKIPAYQAKSIRLRNIMTHKTGFEEAIKELFVPASKRTDTPSLESGVVV